jgi:hypothetical protein
MSASSFKRALETAYRSTDDYVWIYGHGSAWQTDGPYGKGPTVSNFGAYTTVVKQVRKELCRNSDDTGSQGVH